MQFRNPAIFSYISLNSKIGLLKKALNSVLIDFDLIGKSVRASVLEIDTFQIELTFNAKQILSSSCTCGNEENELCEHIFIVLSELDKRVQLLVLENQDYLLDGRIRFDEENLNPEVFKTYSPNFELAQQHLFVFKDFDFFELDEALIDHFSALPAHEIIRRSYCDNFSLELNEGSFYNVVSHWNSTKVEVKYFPDEMELQLYCGCRALKKKMCTHQTAMLHILFKNEEVGFFFNKYIRQEKYKKVAQEYGLENEENLDDFFGVSQKYGSIVIVPKKKELILLTEENKKKIKSKFLPESIELKNIKRDESTVLQKGLVFSESRYSDNFFLYFFEAKSTKDGRIKNPLTETLPLGELEKYSDVDSIRFLSSISYFKDRYDNDISFADKAKALKIISRNPLKIPFYYHDTKISDNITSSSVKEIDLLIPHLPKLAFSVKQNGKLYEILSYIYLNGKKVNLRTIRLRYQFLFQHEMKLYLIENPFNLKVYNFFKEHNFKLIIPEAKFQEFKEEYLDELENKVEINYTFIKEASQKQLASLGYNDALVKKIYLSESDNYILITPAMQYGDMEVPILSLKQIHDRDENNEWFVVERDGLLENSFAGLLIRQHDSFEEQLGQFDYFYLPKQAFLDTGWFINAFETWRSNDIEIFGFNTIDTKINAQKMKVSIAVRSGIDWFDTSVKITFGNEIVSLKEIQKAIKNQHKYVALGDGTKGLMPEEWIAKFSKYFRTSEIVDGNLRTSKINFSVIDDLFEKEVLDEDVYLELSHLKSKVNNFQAITKIDVPKTLKAELRDYQKEGLNWLHFLDEFNFGGCLADDMGLGKTVQVLAFLLSLKSKNKNQTHLIVLPTSLVFNWQRELDKFAPSLKYFVFYGANRKKETSDFSKCDLIITSYGTMLSDITLLKEFDFSYIILDESQAIKNPDSQRYKAARLLKGKNRLVLTGTPIENNTFDLFAQMSFVNPTLFFSQKRFKDEFSTPIDKFKDIARAKELQQRINPFLLRRTKRQVAQELPEKTEMLLYCEMEAEQRKVYDTFKKEIRTKILGKHDDNHENKSMLILQGLMKLRQICNSPAILNDEVSYGNESAKLKFLVEEIQTKSNQHKILVFSQFVSMLDLVRAELDKLEISHEYLTGKTKNREEKVHSFQNDPEIRVFLISLKAGGTGLNLTEADYVYLIDPWWNPAVENQAIDRCYRIGQKKNVVAVRLVTPDSIEEKILTMQENKKELVDELIKTDQSILKSLSQDELVRLFD